LKGEGIIENETEQTKKALVCKSFTTVKFLRKNDERLESVKQITFGVMKEN
jgi:hypothetical protein